MVKRENIQRGGGCFATVFVWAGGRRMDRRSPMTFGLSDVRRESSRQMTFFLISRGQEPDKDTDKNKHGRTDGCVEKKAGNHKGK